MPYRTLGDLRSELQARLGFGASGASPGANKVLLDSWLREAQKELYLAGAWRRLQAYEDKTLGASQYLLDYPATANQDKDIRIEVDTSTGGDPYFEPLTEGIRTCDRNNASLVSVPRRFECREQIEFRPINDTSRTVRIHFTKALGAFDADGDRATVDDDMILLHATATGKAHYRHPDASAVEKRKQDMLDALRGAAWTQKVFRRREDQEPPPKPVVV